VRNVAIRRVYELTPTAKAVVEAELGRPLRGDEEVSIMAFSPGEAPAGEDSDRGGWPTQVVPAASRQENKRHIRSGDGRTRQ
jgi:hypothetical protein